MNKKFCYRKELSASVMLSWCTMTFLGRNSVMANQPLLRGQESYSILRNNARLWPLCLSRSFKVTDFGTHWKPICDFLLVINRNLPPILHRFQVMADYMSNFR